MSITIRAVIGPAQYTSRNDIPTRNLARVFHLSGHVGNGPPARLNNFGRPRGPRDSFLTRVDESRNGFTEKKVSENIRFHLDG